MTIGKYKIKIPLGFQLTKHEFYTYEPTIEYNEDLNSMYLQEDLLQLTNSKTKITIDLGWYGEVTNNDGYFKIYVIKDSNWDAPLQTFHAKSSKEIYEKLKQLINLME